jgi:hypothetical protein
MHQELEWNVDCSAWCMSMHPTSYKLDRQPAANETGTIGRLTIGSTRFVLIVRHAD